MKTLLILLTVSTAALFAPACGGSANSMSGGMPMSATSMPSSYVGTWMSQPDSSGGVSATQGCSGFQWTVTSQTGNTIAGTFAASCAGGIGVSGTATGQINGNAIGMTASGNVQGMGMQSCAFSLTATGTINADGSMTVPYTGSTCMGPISGTQTLRPQ